MEEILVTRNLSAHHESKLILDNINFALEAGTLTALIGPSGCGKSTLLTCLNRMIESNQNSSWEGSVLIDGADTTTMPVDGVRRLIGMVMQTPIAFPFSIERNVIYGLRAQGQHSKNLLHKTATEMLKNVGLYDEINGNMHQNALALSGGQQQRLCIARALAVKPRVLLLDEPCSALDLASTRAVERTLLNLKSSTTMMLVTHNLAQAKRCADNVLCMVDGRIIWSGSAATLFNESPESNAILESLYA
jgi:phosphate transport system ATP-binding protein